MKGMVLKRQLFRDAVRFGWIAMGICPSMLWTAFCGPDSACAQEASAGSARSVLEIPDASAGSEKEMKPYVEKIEHSTAKIEMLPIPGGSFRMGSPDSEAGRNADEGPVHEVQVGPFWMAKFEVTWDSYDVWMSDLDVFYREVNKVQATPRDELADEFQKSQPTKPYTDMTFGMGKHGYPAICMTQHAARTFCKWLSRKTGRYYRLPTEAEWEYAACTAQRRGFRFGEVHEWTATLLRPWQAGQLPAWAADWPGSGTGLIGQARVLRGASFASRARLHDPRRRGFARPGDDLGFVGFRSCAL